MMNSALTSKTLMAVLMCLYYMKTTKQNAMARTEVKTPPTYRAASIILIPYSTWPKSLFEV